MVLFSFDGTSWSRYSKVGQPQFFEFFVIRLYGQDSSDFPLGLEWIAYVEWYRYGISAPNESRGLGGDLEFPSPLLSAIAGRSLAEACYHRTYGRKDSVILERNNNRKLVYSRQVGAITHLLVAIATFDYLVDPLDEHVSSVEFKTTFTTLANLVPSLNERPATLLANPVDNSIAARIRDFIQINPLFFFRSKSDEDPLEFLDQDMDHTWFKQWKVERGVDTGPIEWEDFTTAFLDKFFPLELREAKVLEFINLRQGNMTLKEYSLKLTQLARYAPQVMADSRSKMTPFSDNHPIPKFRDGNTDSVPGSKSQGSVSSARTNSLCQTCCKNHKGICKASSDVYFGYGKLGHRDRDCPHSGFQGQSSRSSAQSSRPNQRGATSSVARGQCPNRLYAL
ncbi:hypothetical protein FXO38_03907 [Capsicum annuum]|nr:hypothetical protein FXO38_03907 [Capsicum annuum]